MLTRKQKALLERRIYSLIKESIFENGFDENFFMEKKEKSVAGMGLTTRTKVAYGIGAVGKDMVYMLVASYILYYYQFFS